jgi:hypothetical protein
MVPAIAHEHTSAHARATELHVTEEERPQRYPELDAEGYCDDQAQIQAAAAVLHTCVGRSILHSGRMLTEGAASVR